MSTRVEPLFVRFANGDSTTIDVIKALESCNDETTKNIVAKAIDSPPDLSVFREDFKKMLADLAENGVSRRIINYVDSYMKPSLEEYMGSAGSRAGESRWVIIKADDAPWPEALVCYNMCLYLRVYGVTEFKMCAKCGHFFTNKGKYAKYCMEHTPQK